MFSFAFRFVAFVAFLYSRVQLHGGAADREAADLARAIELSKRQEEARVAAGSSSGAGGSGAPMALPAPESDDDDFINALKDLDDAELNDALQAHGLDNTGDNSIPTQRFVPLPPQ